MRVLITGACGQVGSHVAELLLARGDEVLGIDNLATGRREHLADHPNLHVTIGSIADRPLVDRLVAEFKPQVLVHTAASYKDPDDWYGDTLTNCAGAVNLIQASQRNAAGRFIYFQTSLCYGLTPQQQPIRLDHPKNPANSSYAISKTAAEDYIAISGIDYVTFRLANVVGPRNVSGPLPIFFQRLRDGKRCFVTTARRDFVFVKDLARTVVRAVDGTGHGAYHFSSGTDVAIQELYDAVVAAMKIAPYPAPEIRPIGADEAPSILLDPSRTIADFGTLEFTSLTETVAAAVAYYQQYGTLGEYTHLKQTSAT
jgi:nucleoside-diphosphate-sugar epimerase